MSALPPIVLQKSVACVEYATIELKKPVEFQNPRYGYPYNGFSSSKILMLSRVA